MSQMKLWSVMLVLCLLPLLACAGKQSPAEGDFWGMAPLHAQPFDIQVLSSEVKDGIRNEEIYYTSELGQGGKPVRIYAYLAGPVQPKGKAPVILMIHGGGGTADKGAPPWMAGMLGAYVLSLDWSGPLFPEHKRYSLFEAVMDPKLASSPCYVTPDLSDASLKHISRACLRGVDLLLAQKSADPDHVFVMGGSWGGFLSLLTTEIDPRITSASGAFGGGAFRETGSFLARELQKKEVSPAQRDFWYRHFDPIGLAGNLKRPIQLETGTNDRFFWLESNATTYKALPPGSVVGISPNTDHTQDSRFDSTWIHWFKTQLGTEPAWPALKDFHFNGKQASWRASGPSPVTQSVLVFSPGRGEWPARCWLEFPAQASGPKFSLQLPQWAQGVEGDAFALIVDQMGRTVTSIPLHVQGKSLAEFSQGRPEPGLVEDFADGTGRWRNAMYIPGQTLAWRKPAPGKAGALELSRADGKAGDLGIETNTINLAAGKLGPQGTLTFQVDTAGIEGKLKVLLVEHAKMGDEKIFTAETALKTKNGGGPGQIIELPLAGFLCDGKAPAWGRVDELRIELKAPDHAKYAFADFRIK